MCGGFLRGPAEVAAHLKLELQSDSLVRSLSVTTLLVLSALQRMLRLTTEHCLHFRCCAPACMLMRQSSSTAAWKVQGMCMQAVGCKSQRLQYLIFLYDLERLWRRLLPQIA